jgi:hypothetical protein
MATSEIPTAEMPVGTQGYNKMELLAMECGAEIVNEAVNGNSFNEATFKANCAVIRAKFMVLETGAEELSEFKRRV